VATTNSTEIEVVGFYSSDFSGNETDTARVRLSASDWTGGILVDTGDGDDVIDIAGVDLGRAADLLIATSTGYGQVLFDTAPTDIRGGNLTIEADEVTTEADVDSGGGNVIITATGDVAFHRSVDTGGGRLIVDADIDGDGDGAFLLPDATTSEVTSGDYPAWIYAAGVELNGRFNAPGEVLFRRSAAGHTPDYRVNVGGTATGEFSQLLVDGSINIDGQFALDSTARNGFTPAYDDQFTIIDTTDGVTGTFVGLPEGGVIDDFLGSGHWATISYRGGADGNDVVLTVAGIDYGDAPSSYPTLLADNGARHATAPGFYLGAGVDSEPDGQPDPDAAGDDNNGAFDDEDGVVFTTQLVPGSAAIVEVTASQPGVLGAWIDFGDDGSWAEATDHIFVDRALQAGPNTMTFRVPADATLTPQTFARFRLTSTPGVSFDGLAADGEVEDYEAAITWFGPPAPLNGNAATDTGSEFVPVLTTDGEGNWVAAWSSWDSLGGTIAEDDDIHFVRSTNNGNTWTLPQALNTNATTDPRDDAGPRLATDGDGNWVAVWVAREYDAIAGGWQYDVLLSRSADDAQTWTAPESLAGPEYTVLGANGIGSLDITSDGQGTWIVVWNSTHSLNETIGTDSDVLFARSTDAGETWSLPQPLNMNAAVDSANDVEPRLATDGQGNWVAAWYSFELGPPNNDHHKVLCARSSDNGETWLTPQVINVGAEIDTIWDRFSCVTTDGLGNWFVVWNGTGPAGSTIGDDGDLFLAHSTDAGQTWSLPRTLSANADTDIAHDDRCKLTTDGMGTWVAVWESWTHPTGSSQADVLFARSTDAGRTWTLPQPLNVTAPPVHGNDEEPVLATDGQGRWVAAWYSFDTFGGTIGPDYDVIFAKTFSQLAARHLFYNDSAFDDGPAANAADDGAIAPGKTPLMPGGIAAFESVSSYSKGINGIMLDVVGLPDPDGLSAADFEFRRGNDDDPDGWAAAATPSSITVRPGEGVGGADRVTIVWPDYDPSDPEDTAVANAWLQVTMLATPNTGLAAPEVFYWGSAIGDSGYGNAPGVAAGDVYDGIAAMLNPHDAAADPAAIDDFADYNRDSAVNQLDVEAVRQLRPDLDVGPLRLIEAPPVSAVPAQQLGDVAEVPLPPAGQPGQSYNLAGTSGDDWVVIQPGVAPGDWMFSINASAWIPVVGKPSFRFSGQDGFDTVTILGAGGDDWAELFSGRGSLLGDGYSVMLSNVESITVDGRGGDNEAVLHGSAAIDEFIAWKGGAVMTVAAGDLEVAGFETIGGVGSAGDTAKLYASGGNDSLTADPQSATMTGPGFANTAAGFSAVHGYGWGGFDTAELTGSAGDDRYFGSNIDGILTGSGFFNRAKGFDIVSADGHGGQDTADLRGSAGDDQFTAQMGVASYSGQGFAHLIQGFSHVRGYAGAGGTDLAQLYDSTENDELVANRRWAQLEGGGFKAEAFGFPTMEAYGLQGGFDTAKLFDSAGDDTFEATPTAADLHGPGFSTHAEGFEAVHAYATSGHDTARLDGSDGDDVFLGTPTEGILYGDGFYNRTKHFDRVFAEAHEGDDEAHFSDSDGDDRFYGAPTAAQMIGPGYDNTAERFDRVFASAAGAGLDEARLYDSAGDDEFTGERTTATLSGPAFYIQVEDFSGVHAYATASGYDRAVFIGYEADDRFAITPDEASRYTVGSDWFFNRAKFFEDVEAVVLGGINQPAGLKSVRAVDDVLAGFVA